MDKIKVGKIVNVVGLKGELKVWHYSDYKERFEELSLIYIGDKPFHIKGIRYVKDMVILKLDGIDDRTEAEKYKGQEICFDKKESRVLPEGSYYIYDLVGLNVIEENGSFLGTVSDVIQNGSQDLYEIEREDQKKFLLPAVEEFILEINLSEHYMKVKLIEGLLEN